MDVMTNSPYSAAGWVFRPGLRRGFREIAIAPEGIAFGFCDLGDLSAFPPQRTAFRRPVTDSYQDLPASQYPVLISQFHWFVVSMQEGDLVAMVDDHQGFLYLGRICGPYLYSPAEAPLCNRRAVLWTSVFPISRTSRVCREHWRARTGLFPMGKILELMSAMEGDSMIRMDRDQAG